MEAYVVVLPTAKNLKGLEEVVRGVRRYAVIGYYLPLVHNQGRAIGRSPSTDCHATVYYGRTREVQVLRHKLLGSLNLPALNPVKEKVVRLDGVRIHGLCNELIRNLRVNCLNQVRDVLLGNHCVGVQGRKAHLEGVRDDVPWTGGYLQEGIPNQKPVASLNRLRTHICAVVGGFHANDGLSTIELNWLRELAGLPERNVAANRSQFR